MNKQEKEEFLEFLSEKWGEDYLVPEYRTQELAGSLDFEEKMKRGELICPAGYEWIKQDWGHREFDIFRCSAGGHFAYFKKEDLGRGMIKKADGTIGWDISNGDIPDDTPNTDYV